MCPPHPPLIGHLGLLGDPCTDRSQLDGIHWESQSWQLTFHEPTPSSMRYEYRWLQPESQTIGWPSTLRMNLPQTHSKDTSSERE